MNWLDKLKDERRYSKLKKQVDNACYRYNALGRSVMSNAEYDALKREYLDLKMWLLK